MRWTLKSCCKVGWLIFSVLFPATVFAGGFDYPDHGSLGLARAGAFTAKADDPTAIYYNPAGIARLKGTRVLLNANLLNEAISYQRRNYPLFTDDKNKVVPLDRYAHAPSLVMPEISNDNSPFPTPFFAVTTDLSVLRAYNLVLMVGLYGPHVHPYHTYPRYCLSGQGTECQPTDDATALPSPQRYDVVEQEIFLLYPSLGVAWQPIKGLSVGAVFQAAYCSFDFQTVVPAMDTSENPALDVDMLLDTKDAFTPTGLFGVHWRALPFLELGASVRIGYSIHLEGDVHAQLPDFLQGTLEMTPNPASVNVVLPMPWVVRTGIRFLSHDNQDREKFDIEFDFVWESTSDIEAFNVVTNANFKLSTFLKPVEKVAQEHHWSDTFSFRLGGTYSILDLFKDGNLFIHGGGFYETQAAPEEYTRLSFIPFGRFGLSLGVGVQSSNVKFTVGYSHIFLEERDISPQGGDGRQGLCAQSNGTQGCGSDVRQILPIDPDGGKPIGNGLYQARIDIITVGAEIDFRGN